MRQILCLLLLVYVCLDSSELVLRMPLNMTDIDLLEC